MSSFSIFNYENLTDSDKIRFDQEFAQRIKVCKEQIVNDDVLGTVSLNDVTNLFFKISSGIQAGSGNQNLFNEILAIYSEC